MKRKFTGLVTEIASSANVNGTSTDQVTNFNVKIFLLRESYADLLAANPQRYPFLPGMSATVEIRTKTHRGVLCVPIQAVTTRANDGTAKKAANQPVVETEGTTAKEEKNSAVEPEQFEVVFINRKGFARSTKVKTGIQDNTNIEIMEGLRPGEEVVVAPYGLISKTLKDSTPIELVKIEELYKVKK